MLATDAALMRTQEPALEERRNPVDARQDRLGRLATTKEHSPVVAIAALGQAARQTNVSRLTRMRPRPRTSAAMTIEPAHEGLVHLDLLRHPVPARPHHRASQRTTH